MAIRICKTVFAFLFIILIPVVSSKHHLQSSQKHTLLQIKLLLNSPPFLIPWNNATDFCNTEPSTTVVVVCYDESITQLHIVGPRGAQKLPSNFSITSFFTTLSKLPTLKVLTLVSLGLWGPLPSEFSRLSTLEIINLTSNFVEGNIPPFRNLQTLILESNSFSGKLAETVGSLSSLAVLNLKNNSLNGPLPRSLANLVNLRVLVLSNNNFSSNVPDLSGLTNLQVLDLENNDLGPRFPILSAKISSIVLKNNRFTFGIPKNVESYYQLKVLDISSNRFVGPFPVSLLSLPSITYLNIGSNKFTGMLSENFPCSEYLYLVNLTANLLTGKLPSCLLSDSKERAVSYGGNCLGNGDESQRPVYLCKNEALAVGIIPRSHKRNRVSLGLSICGGVIGAIILATISLFVVRKFTVRKPLRRFSEENAPTVYTSKLLKDARYITQAMKIGALGLSPYRSFSLEELEAATNNFDSSTFIAQGSHDQMYRGRLRDGSFVAIRCLKLTRNHSTQYFMPHIEMISKLRHQNLVCAIGHCFDYNLDDDSSVSRIFLVFEYVPNGTLRSWVSESERQKLTWAQRIAAVTGIAKGIQFLHTGIVPPLYSSNIKATNVVLDQNFVAKIGSYELPLLSDNMGKDSLKKFKTSRAKEHQDKSDIYDLGVLLLEVISGKPINTADEVDTAQDEFHGMITCDEASRRSLVDSEVRNSCSGESVKTMMQICCRCLVKDPAERPSIEDVLWNLQFAAQVQDASQSSDASPLSPLQISSH